MAHLLVIDSDSKTHQLLKETLEPLQYRVFWAKSVSDGLFKASTQYPDIIIQELEFPDKPGLELLLELKSQELIQDIPVLILSKVTERELVLTALKSGGMDYILKPFNSTTMVTKLNRIWKHLLSVRMRKSIGIQTNSVTVKRDGWHTYFYFPTPITIQTLEKFREIYTEHFRKITSRETYFLDIRNQSELSEQQVSIFTTLIAIIGKMCLIISGKNFAALSMSDEINEEHLFISLEDAQKYLSYKVNKTKSVT